MTLATRLWLSGAALPLLVVGSVLLGADRLFHWALERSLDRALLAQAAVESVSLFDGPNHEPHLHMATSPLIESVQPFAPEGVLFGPDGEEVMRYPPEPRAHARERLAPRAPDGVPMLTTQDAQHSRERRLVVTVRAPHGAPYTLRLSAGLAQIDVAASTFHRLALAALLITALVLVLVQTWQARSLQRRLGELSRHVQAMREGELEHPLALERQGDELAALRELLSLATRSLKRARDTRERFVADAAHELRTPLTLMRTNLDLALRRERSNDELKLALSETREEVDRLTALSGRLLDLAALSQRRAERERCDLVALARRAADAARAEAETHGIQLTLDAPARLTLDAHAESVRGALDNLLSNALKYAKRAVGVRIEELGQRARIAVIDDGPGIAASERELVFEPFHRVRSGAPGVGLGLAMVREVARVHGGRAYVAERNEGAEVVLELAHCVSSSEEPARAALGQRAADDPRT